MMLKLEAPRCAMLALCAVTVSAALSTGCVKRDCTDDERNAAGADSNDDCTKFVPLHTFTASKAEEKSAEWSSGTDLKVRGDVRSVQIVKGDVDDAVVVSYKAQVDLAEDRTKDVVEQTMEHLKPSLTRNGDTIEVSANRGDIHANLGAAVVISLPPGFDSDIVINKATALPGDVLLKYLGNTRQLNVDMDALGADLSIADVDAVRLATINTRGDIDINGVFTQLDKAVLHTSHGDIEARFGSAPQGHVKIVADFGEIVIRLPADGAFSLRGDAEQGVSLGKTPKACQTDSDSSGSLLQCNGGDPDGLTFDLKASQEIALGYQ
jgi:Putative adhesin